ncbi:hypothetical protein BDV11DRAFT_201326 [Aspergillus similis]
MLAVHIWDLEVCCCPSHAQINPMRPPELLTSSRTTNPEHSEAIYCTESYFAFVSRIYRPSLSVDSKTSLQNTVSKPFPYAPTLLPDSFSKPQVVHHCPYPETLNHDRMS